MKPTREAVVTGCDSFDEEKGRHGLTPAVGETAMSHWSATARLKLGNPRSIRC
ncbi:hypothetical protein DPMN_192751 [Dreissena polymorpha]|uniref:Uncharacterized protein n=1 Tax=Dreissena polymorpha TaxID=45954 RepID=A0A9D3Y248_DREPO|nr:hypothetical protein DPMN_192751 [Dreissena polymorpha]